jgi:hypothetical protein
MSFSLDKTWHKQSIMTLIDSATADHPKRFLLELKNLLRTGTDGNIGGPVSWSVVGSSNSASFNMSGTDTWSSLSDMVRAAAGTNHSWIVLRNSSLGGGSGLEICFDYVGSSSYMYSTIYSYSAGFTGGARNNRPTATDEVQIQSGTANNLSIFNGVGNFPYSLTKLFSSDGKCNRVITYCGRPGSEAPSLLLIDELKNPTSLVTQNLAISSKTGTFTYSNYSVTANTGNFYTHIGTNSTEARALFMVYRDGSTSYRRLVSYSTIQTPNTLGQYMLFPVGVYSPPTDAYEGKVGELFDAFQVISNLPDRTLFDALGSPRGLVKFGDVLFGNDGTFLHGFV